MMMTLSSKVYPVECIRETAEAYAGLCSVNLAASGEGGDYSVEITPLSELVDEEHLTNEFLNYLLDLSVERYLERA
jgi:hypothetical protein